MIIKENVTLYVCSYCRKVYQMKHFCVLHEDKCVKNPINIDACRDCELCESKSIEIEYHGCNDEWSPSRIKKTRFFHCSKLDKRMHPHSAEKWAEQFEEDFDGSACMPSECEHRKTWSIL